MMVNRTSAVLDQAARLSAVLDGLSARGDHRFEVQAGIQDADGWRSAAVLVDPARGGLLDGASEYLRRRGTRNERVAASILTQVYANRLVGIGIGCWVTGRIVPVLSPDCVLLWFDGARPVRTALRYEQVAAIGDDALAVLGDELFAGHLAGVVDGVHARTGLSRRRLWGNVATSCATAFVLLHQSAPIEERDQVRSDALAFFAAPDWPVHGLIEWHPATAACEPLTFRRRTCCLFRLIPGETPCDTCSLPMVRAERTTI
jgi:Ferric iron reductase FhuF-like transporter